MFVGEFPDPVERRPRSVVINDGMQADSRGDSTAALFDGFLNIFVQERPCSATACHFVTKTPELVDGLPFFGYSRTAFGDQSRYGLLVLRDDDFLAAADSFEQILEPGLGFERANGGHEILQIDESSTSLAGNQHNSPDQYRAQQRAQAIP
jgi:hypothetical protein